MNDWVWVDVPGLHPKLNALYRQSWAILGEIEHCADEGLLADLWSELDLVDQRIANIREEEGL